MDFARKILQNYGWKDGDGLGKNKDGIVKPLRPTLKFDNAGFGADQAEVDFNNHWWERVFNEAATNVNIQQEGKQIKIVVKDNEDRVEISTKCYSMKKLKKLKKNHGESSEMKNNYHNFLKAATLTNLGDEIENPNKIDAADIEVSKVKVLSDEELFKACGGRTAHKGARHGLKLSGKLSRIEQQEAELLAKMMAKRNGLSEETQNMIKMDTKIPKANGRKKKSKINDKHQELCRMDNVDRDKLVKKKRKHCEIENPEETVAELKRITEDKCRKKKMKQISACEDVATVTKEIILAKTNEEIKSSKMTENKNEVSKHKTGEGKRNKKKKRKNKNIE